MSPAKVMLSPTEQELVNNADWILTKNAVIAKVYTLFGYLSEAYKQELDQHPSLVLNDAGFLSPKITRGEYYEGLPWVILDHPRCFTNTDTFAVRSFFWWGKCCSITLQLSGSFLEKYTQHIHQYFETHACEGWYTNINTDPWKHHFETDNYIPLEKNNLDFSGRPFIKLAKKISLADWTRLPDFFTVTYREIIEMLVQ